jgi:hypothetical protein
VAQMDRKQYPPGDDSRERTKKFGLVLQGGGALGEVGAIEYLYESGMGCAIVSGASSGAMNAVTLAGAKGYPPVALRSLWEKLVVEPPVPFIPPLVKPVWAMFGSPHMYTPRWDYWNALSWTYFCETTPLKKTLEELLDWEQVRDSEHMRLIVLLYKLRSRAVQNRACVGQREPAARVPLDDRQRSSLLGRRFDR